MNAVYEVSDIENVSPYIEQVKLWSDLWYDDLEEAGVSKVYFAFDGEDGEEVLGFQSVSPDGLTVAIEVKDCHRGKGVAMAMIRESNSWKPERNENSEFWAAIESEFLY